MSVKVDLDKLADTLADFAFGYLITVGDDFRAHTVAVVPDLVDGVLEFGVVGDTTKRNATAHAAVTLLWPPSAPEGYSVIVDGIAEVTSSGLHVVPTRAVLHRRAAPTAPGLHDCVPLKAQQP